MKELSVVGQYREWLSKYGDTPQGVGWNRAEQVSIRHQVMLECVEVLPARVLDFGCGTGAFLDFLHQRGTTGIEYCGIDILEESILLAKRKHPHTAFVCGDILNQALDIPEYDYAIINGVLTYKHAIPFDEMWNFGRAIIEKLFINTKKGLAVNFMTKAVDWERDDLFHMPVGMITDFITKNLTKRYVVRHDYRLYDYTVYLYK